MQKGTDCSFWILKTQLIPYISTTWLLPFTLSDIRAMFGSFL